MTVILVLLCLAIAGRELYLAFERGRSPGAPEIADIRTQLRALKGTRDELERLRASQRERLDGLERDRERDRADIDAADARIRSLVAQINDRMVPDVNDRLNRQREAVDLQRDAVERLAAEVAGLRAHLVGRLEQAVAASLGAAPADIVAGTLAVRPGALRPAVAGPYEQFAERYGLRVELAHCDSYFLSGRNPRALERDFVDLVQGLCSDCAMSREKARPLLDALHGAERGTAQIGPLVLVRTPESLVAGVLPLAELLRPETACPLDDPEGAARRLRKLPQGRVCDLTGATARDPAG